MNILFFATDVARQSGASYALRETVRRLSASGVKPVVVIPDSPDSRELFPGGEFDVVYLGMQRVRRTLNPAVQAKYLLLLLPTLARLCRIIRDRRIEIVHFNEITDFLGGVAARLCGIPCACHVRADGIPNPYRRVLLAILKHVADAIVVPSVSTSSWMAADMKDLAPRIRVIHDYAFDLASYDPGTSGAAFRREFGIGPGETMVLLVSKLMVAKGHLCFIRAAHEVFRKSARIAFVVVGGPVEGHESEAREIEALARELAPGSRLILAGPRQDLAAAIAACDIFVHCPVYPDPYPTVVLLGMSMGKPVIGTDIGGIPEQIGDGRYGVLVPPGSPEALAGAILALAGDPGRRERIGATAMEQVRQDFNPRKQAGLLTGLYEHLLAKDAA